ncbi:MAG: ATP-binding protein [Ghiorsea sp.]|nr:ATP-binding protein [Ghiorsea sp.]
MLQVTSNTADKKKVHLKKLFFSRMVASVVLLLIFTWFEVFAHQQPLTLTLIILGVWTLLSVTQLVLFRFPKFSPYHILLQLCSDFILLGLIIYGSGGLTSPFVFLLGLVIIIAGSQARVLFTLFIAVLAATSYLIAIYALPGTTDPENTLKILLQTSLFFLTGGIMALIARRHALLQSKEQETSSEHKQLQEIHGQVLQAMHEGVITLTTRFSIQAFNPAASSLFNLSPQDIGSPIQHFITVPDSRLDSSKNGRHERFQYEVSQNNLDLLLTCTPLHDDNDVYDTHAAAWLLTIVDVTQTRQLERKLGEKNKLATIGQMAALLAHEIRNPMQTISQAAELMGLQHENKKLEHMITDEVARLNRLLSDMLDYAHPLQPQPKYTNMKALVSASIEQVDLTHQHNIRNDIPHIDLLIDPDHFRLMLDNLLRNAIRVSPQEDSIQVILSTHKDQWKIIIRDHGTGIDPSIQDTLFQPFQTGYKTGMGLGLATVWQVCQANTWKINIDESIVDGACFIIQGSINNDFKTLGEHHG